MEEKRLYTTKEAAKYLNIGESTLRGSRKNGELLGYPSPEFSKLGAKVIYLKEALDDWLNSLPKYMNTNEARMSLQS